MGLLIRWSGDYRRSARWSWTRVLVEAPTAIGLGIIGGGLASYLQAPPEAAWGIAALLGNLGTRGFFDLVAELFNRRQSACLPNSCAAFVSSRVRTDRSSNL